MVGSCPKVKDSQKWPFFFVLTCWVTIKLFDNKINFSIRAPLRGPIQSLYSQPSRLRCTSRSRCCTLPTADALLARRVVLVCLSRHGVSSVGFLAADTNPTTTVGVLTCSTFGSSLLTICWLVLPACPRASLLALLTRFAHIAAPAVGESECFHRYGPSADTAR